MAITFTAYNSFKQKLLNQANAIDFDDAGTSIKIAFVQAAYTPNIDTHDFFDDITNELSGGGYTAGGYALDTKAVNLDTVNDRAEFDAADEAVTGVIGTYRYVILYKDTGTASTSPLIGYWDMGANITLIDTAIQTFQWNAEGILQVS